MGEPGVSIDETDDLEIIQGAIAGDERAFDRMVQLYAARLLWLIKLRLDPAVRARVSPDDVLQDALVVVSQQIGKLVVESEAAFWTWLCRVVEQRLVDVRRRHKVAAARSVAREQPAAADERSVNVGLDELLMRTCTTPSARLRGAEQRAALEHALEQLPGSFREVIVLRILEGLSVADTAHIMGRSPGAVSVLLTKAVKRLGRIIGEGKPEDA